MTRFDGLFQQAKRGDRALEPEHPDTQTSEHPDTQTSRRPSSQTPEQPDARAAKVGKGKDSRYKRTTVYLLKQTHQKLKAAAVEDGREMSEILQELAEAWLASRHSDVQ